MVTRDGENKVNKGREIVESYFMLGTWKKRLFSGEGVLQEELQAQRTASVKVLGQECGWCFQKTAVRPCGGSKEKGLKSENAEGPGYLWPLAISLRGTERSGMLGEGAL